MTPYAPSAVYSTPSSWRSYFPPIANRDSLSRPVVRLVSDALGNVLRPAPEVDLAQQDGNGDYPRTIIKTADPERYGINVGDYIIE
ncbi:MAG: hypothetical protein ABIR58_06790 [Gemmatimonadaceae bacterium]